MGLILLQLTSPNPISIESFYFLRESEEEIILNYSKINDEIMQIYKKYSNINIQNLVFNLINNPQSFILTKILNYQDVLNNKIAYSHLLQ